MVSPIKFHRTDPNRRGRGAGYYYKRNSYKRGWHSKFTETRDGIKRSQETRFTKPYRHTGDARPSRRTTMKVGKKKILGWF